MAFPTTVRRLLLTSRWVFRRLRIEPVTNGHLRMSVVLAALKSTIRCVKVDGTGAADWELLTRRTTSTYHQPGIFRPGAASFQRWL